MHSSTLAPFGCRAATPNRPKPRFARPSRWSRTFVDAQLALANFLWAAERAPEAEAVLKEVLAKEPQHLLANRMLGVLYLSTNRVSEAEQPLKNVADISKTPAARLQLADYYIGVGRTNDAVSLLNSLATEQASSADAELRLAALDYAPKARDGSPHSP